MDRNIVLFQRTADGPVCYAQFAAVFGLPYLSADTREELERLIGEQARQLDGHGQVVDGGDRR